MPELTEQEKQTVKDRYKSTQVPDIAKELKRGQATIYAYLREKGWKPFKNATAPRERNHPFRKKNRQLEAVVIQRRIENRAANPKRG